MSCLEGKVWDIAVDLRRDSPTFGKWYGVELTAENKIQFYVPRGFAHGFVVLSETAVFPINVIIFITKNLKEVLNSMILILILTGKLQRQT